VKCHHLKLHIDITLHFAERRVYETVARLSHHSTALAASGGFAAERPAVRGAGAEQQMRTVSCCQPRNEAAAVLL